MGDERNGLSLRWTFGFSKDALRGVHAVSSGGRPALFYTAAHTGVIYDHERRTEMLLQGHCNLITCSAASEDGRYVVTADAGEDSMVVVWDAATGTPVRTIFSPCPEGVVSLDLSPDADILAILSERDAEGTQEVSVWEWADDKEAPACSLRIAAPDRQHAVRLSTTHTGELLTTGAQSTLFWTWHGGELRYHRGRISKRSFRQAFAAFTDALFIPNSFQAVTATAEGDAVLWDSPSALDESVSATDAPSLEASALRSAIKVVHLTDSPLHCLQLCGDYIVTGSGDGAVRFYDHGFRLEAWFEDLEAGPVTSVSISGAEARSTSDGFRCPDFVVGTAEACIIGMAPELFDEPDAAARGGTLLVQGASAEVPALALDPTLPRVVIGVMNGTLQLWDYAEKALIAVRTCVDLDDPSQKVPPGVRPPPPPVLLPQSLAMSPPSATPPPLGGPRALLVAGFTNGLLRLMDADSFRELITFRNATAPILIVRISRCGTMIATADAESHVALFRLQGAERTGQLHVPEHGEGEGGKELTAAEAEAAVAAEGRDPLDALYPHWTYIGRRQSHGAPITGLAFGEREGVGPPALLSVGADRRVVAYDLEGSSVGAGLLLRGAPSSLEQVAEPTAVAWLPVASEMAEDRFVTANTELKLKQWSSSGMECRRTTMGPTFGGPVVWLEAVPRSPGCAEAEFFAYATSDRVIGLCRLPLDGNPDGSMGVIAHPGRVAAAAVSHDGRYLLTSGGADLTVNVFEIDTAAVGGKGAGKVEAFLSLLEGGRGGEEYAALQDYFSYAELCAAGERSTVEREIRGAVPLEAIPNLFRAMGYYPSERATKEAVAEARHGRFSATGKIATAISLEDFLCLYLNHRPVRGVTSEDIAAAFDTLAGGRPTLSSEALAGHLLAAGETLGKEELAHCLEVLTGNGAMAPGGMSVDGFIDGVLGLADDESLAEGP